MKKFLTNVLNAAGLIVGDIIEGWASQVPRSQLSDDLRAQSDRINDLEAELDRLHEENIKLRSELQSDSYHELQRPGAGVPLISWADYRCPECKKRTCDCIPF